MYYLGLDASTKSTGYAIYENDKLIKHGTIRSNKQDVFDRIEDVYNGCRDIFKKYNIHYVFIEDVPLSYAVNKRVAEKLILLQGTIYSLCLQYDCGFIQLEPSSWRKKAGVVAEKNRREFQKKAAIELVEKQYHFGYKWIDKKYDEQTGDSDVCEAILIGKAGVSIMKGNLYEA